MVARFDFGQRDVGGVGLSISAPGENVTRPGARLLFSSDARYSQILFEGQLALSTKQEDGPPWDGSSVGTKITTGYGLWLFPRALPFKPYCRLTVTYQEDGQQRYRVGQGVGAQDEHVMFFAPQADRVELFFRYRRNDNTRYEGLVAKMAVFNVQVDG